jgi:4-hydroxy-3-methylbut-2-enyl diphosphate reductase IspH
MANQDHLLNNQSGDLKMISGFNQTTKSEFTFNDISYEYINKLLEENSKTNESILEMTKNKLETVRFLSL